MKKLERANKKWTEDELRLLKLHYGLIPTAVLAELLGRTPKAIRMKAYKLGIKAKFNSFPKYIKVKYRKNS